MNLERLSVVGLGYIGLPTAALFAAQGLKVIGVDINPHTVASVNAGQVPIIEPHLDKLVKQVVNSGHLRATLTIEPADAFIIAVPTPFKANYTPDLSYVKAAVESIAPVLQKNNLIILESTSPIGTTANLARWIMEIRPDLNVNEDLYLAYCPERVLPGHILYELVKNSRVIGGVTPQAAHEASHLYRLFVEGECLITDANTAEMVKLTENAFRDVNIAFANELSMICDKLDINVWELIRLANHHPRVNILQPGPGVGGHCIAVDPWFIVDAAPRDVRLIRAAREVNDAKPAYVVEEIESLIKQCQQTTSHPNLPTVACLGLSYKANIDDVRESPAVEIVTRLAYRSACAIQIVEPHIQQLPTALRSMKNVSLTSLDNALVNATLIVLLVDHTLFKQRLNDILMADKLILDTRGLVFTTQRSVKHPTNTTTSQQKPDIVMELA